MNKEKKLKLILSSFKEKQLIKFFQTFLEAIKCKFYKSIKQISFSCYQSTCQVDNYMVNGYGKTSSEALISGINNLIDCLIEEEDCCEIMRQCLRKFNVSPYGLASNGSTSKKQLLSTQKALKTMGAQTSVSIQKKVLTMSANLSSNSKDSSSKAKSIKEQIFEYFNLQNLKVKNPNNSFSSVSPMNNKLQKHVSATQQTANIHRSKQKFTPIGKQLQMRTSVSQADRQLQQVNKRIRQVQEKISLKQKQNTKIKQEIQNKKKSSQPNGMTANSGSNNNYFTRPLAQNNKALNTKFQQSKNIQSIKKVSYLELNQKYQIGNQKRQKENNNKPSEVEKKHESYFQNVQIYSRSKETSKVDPIIGKWHAKDHHNSLNPTSNKLNQQRKCLVDISNIKTQAAESSTMIQKSTNQYTSTFNTSSIKNISSSSQSKPLCAFQTINTAIHSQAQNNERISNPILYPKASQQQKESSISIIESSKKLRSFSVQNSLAEKVHGFNTGIKNPIAILNGGNLNSSFDNGTITSSTIGITQKKMNIPRLNLEILPNYHGKSNKSLNQSLMQNYEKKNQTAINTINE